MPDSSDSLFSALLAEAGPRQSNRLLALHTPLGTDVLLAEHMVCEESIGPGNFLTLPAVIDCDREGHTPQTAARRTTLQDITGYRLSFTALSTNVNLSLDDLRGKSARMEWLTDGDAGPKQRCVHGCVTRFELLGSDNGLARYAGLIEPGVRLLQHEVDAWAFQGKSVVQIIDEVLGEQAAALKLVWRWELADESVYPIRSLCTQFNESTWQFIARLLAEEGLFFWFEHSAEGGELGQHTLVIADHNTKLKAHPSGSIRYTQSNAAVFKTDSLREFNRAHRMVPTEIIYGSYDHRSTQLVSAQAKTNAVTQAKRLSCRDVPGAYTFENTQQAERLALRHLEALQLPAHRCEAQGTWRAASVGSTFTLSEHPAVPSSTAWVTLGARHRGRNNFSAEHRVALQQRLGALPATLEIAPAPLSPAASAAAKEETSTEPPLYECRLIVQDVQYAVRAPLRGNSADSLFDRPQIVGVQTAVVVGTQEAVHTDRDNRIKVQFHWQRGAQASHRLTHALGSNAPGNDSAGTWVRMASSTASMNSGESLVARRGQEALIAFIEGDVDRPVCVGLLYSGRGAPNAQGNQVSQGPSGATGNAGAWFPGDQGGHAHGAVLTGFKTQSMDTSQAGKGSYNKFVFDDTPSQSRAALGTTSLPGGGDQATWMNLGHLLHQVDNQRLVSRGHGLELVSTGQGAVRGGRGVLLSSFGQAGGTGAEASSVDVQDAVVQLAQAEQLTRSLIDTAKQHQSTLPQVDAHSESIVQDTQTATAELSLPKQQATVLESLRTTGDPAGGGGGGSAPAWDNPDLVLSAPALATATPAHTVLASGTTASLVAQQDLNLNAQRNLAVSVMSGMGWFTYGKVPVRSSKANTETGMSLHAATGKVSLRSNANQVALKAQNDVRVTSTDQGIKISGPKHVMFVAGGSALRIEPGKITLTTLRNAYFRASLTDFTSPGAGADSSTLPLPRSTQRTPGQLDLLHQYVDPTGAQVEPLKQGGYTVTDALGKVHEGTLSGAGTATVAGLATGVAKVVFGKDPRNPWDPGSYFGKADDWKLPDLPSRTEIEENDEYEEENKTDNPAEPSVSPAQDNGSESSASVPGTPAMAGVLGAAAVAQAAMAQVSPMASAAKQAVTAAQAIQGGAGLDTALAPLTQQATGAATNAAAQAAGNAVSTAMGGTPAGALATGVVESAVPVALQGGGAQALLTPVSQQIGANAKEAAGGAAAQWLDQTTGQPVVGKLAGDALQQGALPSSPTQLGSSFMPDTSSALKSIGKNL